MKIDLALRTSNGNIYDIHFEDYHNEPSMKLTVVGTGICISGWTDIKTVVARNGKGLGLLEDMESELDTARIYRVPWDSLRQSGGTRDFHADFPDVRNIVVG